MANDAAEQRDRKRTAKAAGWVAVGIAVAILVLIIAVIGVLLWLASSVDCWFCD